MRLSIFIKTLIFLIILLFVDYQLVAQGQGAPESMNYQAVIRNGSGDIVASQSVGIRIDILQGSATGTSVYQETFTTTTNAYGSIAIQIGTGTVVSGTFNTIDWGANSYYVETAVDISGGPNFITISTTQFMSVPYALYAKNAGLDSAAIQAMIDASGGSGSLVFSDYQDISLQLSPVNSTNSYYNTGSWTNNVVSQEFNSTKDGFLIFRAFGACKIFYFYSDNPNVLNEQEKLKMQGSDGTITMPILKNKFWRLESSCSDLLIPKLIEFESSSSSGSSSSGSDANTLIYTSDGF